MTGGSKEKIVFSMMYSSYRCDVRKSSRQIKIECGSSIEEPADYYS
ncbi:hypothetical protein QY97_03110 [Bacillus thermotolerans]|uniref:Uncharacterized protein n=1 Tax=Bacillus thermotolerans TaxID=1221996 RepID=A0A0F5HJV0_BACTR|nr:hypothetical protein QY97_03110 [Bacillus thermotolerans]KKB41873.1 hypothetical protein QY95_00491 [Bacillus thermotolerans]